MKRSVIGWLLATLGVALGIGASLAADKISGNTPDRGKYFVASGTLNASSANVDSAIYLFEPNPDSTVCTADSMRWAYMNGTRMGGQQYLAAKIRKIQHVEFRSTLATDIYVRAYHGGSFMSIGKYHHDGQFGFPVVLTPDADSLRVKIVTSGAQLLYTCW